MMTSLHTALSQPRFGATIQLKTNATATELSQAQTTPFQNAIDLVTRQAELSQEIATLDDRESPVTLGIYLGETGTASAWLTSGNGRTEASLNQNPEEPVVEFAKRAIGSVKTYCQGLLETTQRRQTVIDKAVPFVQGLLTAAESGQLAKGSQAKRVSIGGKEYQIDMSACLSGQWSFEYRFSDPLQRGGPQFRLQLSKANELIGASINDPRLGQYDFIGGRICPIQAQVAQVEPLARQLHALLGKLHEQKVYQPSEYGRESFREPRAGESQFQHHGYPFPLNWEAPTA